MLNSKFGLRQAANVIAASGGTDQMVGSSFASNNGPASPAAGQAESYVIAKYDYDSQGPQELSIRKGDRLLLLDDSRHWWRVLNSNNLTGFVPSNYVKREKQSLFDSIRRGIRANTKPKKSSNHQTSINDQSPTCPLIPKDPNNDLTSISPIHEHQRHISSKKPYDSKASDNTELHKSDQSNGKRQQSHGDILVRELGPSFSLAHVPTYPKPGDSNNNNANNGRGDLLNFKNDPANEADDLLLKSLTSTTATVKYNYKSQQPDELALIKGSKIVVLEKSEDGWWKGNLDGQVGWFPSNYVVEQSHLDLDNVSSSVTTSSHTINKQIASPSKQQVTGMQSKQDSYDMNSTNFNAASASDINAHKISSPLNSSILTDQSRLLQANSNRNNHRVDHNLRNPNSHANENEEVLFVVVALYSFQAQSEGELSFTKAERLEIIEKPINDPDWWLARNQASERGLVPKNYVQIIPNVKSIRAWSSSTEQTSVSDGTNKSKSATNGNDAPTRFDPVQIQNSFDSSSPLSSSQQLGTSKTFNLSINYGNGTQDENSSSADQQLRSSRVYSPSLAQLARDLEVKLNLTEKVWYHGVMSRQQCDQLMNAYAEDGDFLIRNSETSAGDFSVSLKAPVRNKHFRVNYVNDGFCIGQRRFESLDELVEHYKRTPIYTSASGEKMFLKKPYCR